MPKSVCGSDDIEYSRQNNSAEIAEIPQDIDSENCRNILDSCVIRVLEDLGEIVLLDGRTVNLRREDVVTVPVLQASGLIQKGKAIEVHTGGLGPHSWDPLKRGDPGLTEFKAKVNAWGGRHTCASCGQHFDTPLVVRGRGGYICEPCRRGDEPIAPQQADSQTKLAEVQAT